MQTKEYRRERYLKKKEQILAQTKEWAKNNPEKRKIIKDRWRAKNKERTNFLCRQYHYRRKHNMGKVSFEDIQKLKNMNCVYCGKKANTVDHIIPLTKGGSNYIHNLAPACNSCNSSKGNKDLLQFKPLLFMMWDRLETHAQ